jgi:hypothetical protein
MGPDNQQTEEEFPLQTGTLYSVRTPKEAKRWVKCGGHYVAETWLGNGLCSCGVEFDSPVRAGIHSAEVR